MTRQSETAARTHGTPPELIAGTSFIGVPLMLTAIRCMLQYIVVPLVLPLFSIGSTFSPLVNLGVELLGIGIIAYNMTRLWNTNWRRRYLLLSLVVIPILLGALYFDYLAYSAIGGTK